MMVEPKGKKKREEVACPLYSLVRPGKKKKGGGDAAET